MLKALLCERTEDAAAGVSYSEHLVPLSSVPEEMCPWRDADIRAWRSLQKVPSMSPRAVKAIVRSLLSTVVDPDAPKLAASEFSFGTQPVDLRPLLCNPAGEERVLSELSEAVEAHRESSELPDWHWTHRHQVAALPKGFQRHFLWGLSLAPWAHVELMLAVYETLGLERSTELSLAMGHFTVCTPRDTVLWWCDVLADVPSELRVVATGMVVASEARSHRPSDAIRSALASGDIEAARATLRTH